ncbi:MAG: hypothetical protein ACOY0T_04595 [Myxococcota bacterium]
MTPRAAALALGLVMSASKLGLAAPSIWESARDARAKRAERVLVRIERVFAGLSEPSADAGMLQDFRQGTILIAEMSGARALGDPRIIVLFARALLGPDREREQEARTLLEQALAALQPDEAWLEAELRPLLALSSHTQPSSAVTELTRALASAWHPALRGELLRRRSEAHMALSDVRAAVRDARSARSIASTPAERILASLALGLALERSGDQPAAFAELHTTWVLASTTREGEMALTRASEAFVFRPHDADYAIALVAMEGGASSDGDEQRAAHYRRALELWEDYLRSAAKTDRWLGAARAHQRACEKAMRALGAASR